MNCQMIRVISSPSSSTTVPSTLIFATCTSLSTGSEPNGSEVGYVGLLGPHGLGGLTQPGLLALGQVSLDDPAHTLTTDLALDAQVDAVDAVLAVDPCAHGHDRAGVLHHGAGHAGRGRRRGVVRRAGLEQRHDLGPAVSGAVDQVVDAVLRHHL